MAIMDSALTVSGWTWNQEFECRTAGGFGMKHVSFGQPLLCLATFSKTQKTFCEATQASSKHQPWNQQHEWFHDNKLVQMHDENAERIESNNLSCFANRWFRSNMVCVDFVPKSVSRVQTRTTPTSKFVILWLVQQAWGFVSCPTGFWKHLFLLCTMILANDRCCHCSCKLNLHKLAGIDEVRHRGTMSTNNEFSALLAMFGQGCQHLMCIFSFDLRAWTKSVCSSLVICDHVSRWLRARADAGRDNARFQTHASNCSNKARCQDFLQLAMDRWVMCQSHWLASCWHILEASKNESKLVARVTCRNNERTTCPKIGFIRTQREFSQPLPVAAPGGQPFVCLLYTSDAADE